MKYLYLVWRNLTRRKIRTILTILSILVAFVLFSYLSAIRLAFSLGVDVTGADRLITIHKVSLIQPLPLSYEGRLTQIPGVVHVAHATWFGGKYQDVENRFPVIPVEPEPFLEMYPEYVLDESEAKAWSEDRTGAVVGRKTADRFDLEVGDRLPIQGTIFYKSDGSATWEFNIVGIYEAGIEGADVTQVFLRYDYFNEAREFGKDLVGWYMVRVENPDDAARVAAAIDERFTNSTYETETSREKAFVQGFAKQIGNIGAILRFVLTAVFFTILLVVGNTMALSVRERTGELAVLKTLGFSDTRVLLMVLGESLFLALLGGGAGLLLGLVAVGAGDPTSGVLPDFRFPRRDIAIGVVLAVALGLVSGFLPALQAMRLRIVDALRRT